MDLDQREQTQPESGGHIKRRGLVAGLAVLVAGAVAKATERVAEAGHTPNVGTPGADSIALHLGATNTQTGGTTLNGTSATFALTINNPGGGIFADTTPAGGTGIALSGRGGGFGAAVQGNNPSSGLGVYGFSTGGSGVRGDASSGFGFGVYGVHTNGNTGVFGQSFSTTGLEGTTLSGGGQAVFGHVGGAGTGVYGTSASGTGVFGTTTAGGLAGRFVGNVSIEANSSSGQRGDLTVNGNLTVQGTKSAAVPLSDGSLALLYCLESPDSYFVDFYDGQVSNGQTTVTLEAKFAQTVQTNGYDVYLTANGPSNGLYVASRSASSFVVRENGTPTAGGVSFSAQVVAKRKDVAAPRLATFTRPAPSNQPAPKRHQVRDGQIVELPEQAQGNPPAQPRR